jgi:hypothetical protein
LQHLQIRRNKVPIRRKGLLTAIWRSSTHRAPRSITCRLQLLGLLSGLRPRSIVSLANNCRKWPRTLTIAIGVHGMLLQLLRPQLPQPSQQQLSSQQLSARMRAGQPARRAETSRLLQLLPQPLHLRSHRKHQHNLQQIRCGSVTTAA